MYKSAKLPQRSFKITEEERRAAKEAISAFKKFLEKLQANRLADKRLMDVLEKNKDADASSLFDIRHLLRKFQKEMRERYTNLVYLFSGKKDLQNKLIDRGVIHTLDPLQSDSTINHIKDALQDAMQQLVENAEETLESFENFGDQNQIKQIINTDKKAEQIVSSIENVIDKQLRGHLERNVLKRLRASEITNKIRRRARIIDMLVKNDN